MNERAFRPPAAVPNVLDHGRPALAMAHGFGPIMLSILVVLSALGATALGTSAPGPATGSMVRAASSAHGATGPTLLLSPANGTVGATISASGSGLQANLPVALSMSGIPLSTRCSSDSGGNFPGTTGTPCTFVVPPHVGGSTVVTAAGGWAAADSFGVYDSPGVFVVDPDDNKLFLTEGMNSSNVTVINITTDRTVGSILLPGFAIAGWYDSTGHELWTADGGSSDLVSVINTTTDRVIANISIGSGSRPVYPMYDPGTNQVFVTNSAGNNVTIISAKTLTTVGSVNVGTWPTGILYIPATHELYVVNSQDNTVSVIADNNDTVVATIGVGSNPRNMVLDAALGQVLVENYMGNDVSVISVANQTDFRTIGVGNGPDVMDIDPILGETLVTNINSNNLSFIDDATGRVVQTLSMSGGPQSVAYVASRNSFYVAAVYSNYATRFAASTPVNATFGVLTDLTVPGSVEVGGIVRLSGSGFAATAAIAPLTLGSSNLTCVGATDGSCTGGVASTDENGSFALSLVVPSIASGGTNRWTAADGFGHWANATGTVLLDPTATAPVASPSVVVVDSSVSFRTSAAEGSGGYTYVWNGLPNGCITNDQPSLTCAPTRPGVYLITVTVTDSAGFSGTSPGLLLTVLVEYRLVFLETGLPVGSSWGVVVGAATETSTTSTLTFNEPNGTYSYVVLPPVGYISGSAGYTTVNGSDDNVSVTFHLQEFPVVFVVIGLPAGSNWSVTLTNASTGFHETASSLTSSIVVFLPNGTYHVAFSFPANFSANISSTAITVAGHPTGATVGANMPLRGGGGGTTSAFDLIPVIAAVIGALAGLGVGALVASRRRGRPPPPAPMAASSATPPAERPASTDPPRTASSPAADPLDEVF